MTTRAVKTRKTVKTADAGIVPEPVEATAPGGKLGALVALLRREGGATIAQMVEATGWQAHSVRGAIAGSLKKKHGLAVASEKTDGDRIYRAVTAAA